MIIVADQTFNKVKAREELASGLKVCLTSPDPAYNKVLDLWDETKILAAVSLAAIYFSKLGGLA